MPERQSYQHDPEDEEASQSLSTTDLYWLSRRLGLPASTTQDELIDRVLALEALEPDARDLVRGALTDADVVQVLQDLARRDRT